MKFIYSYVPFENDFFSEAYDEQNFINLAKVSFSTTKSLGSVVVYTTKQLIPFFKEKIDNQVTYREIEKSKTFAWYKYRYISILNEIEIEKTPLVHVDFDMFFLKNCFINTPDFCLSHAEPHNHIGSNHLDFKKIPRSHILDFYDDTFSVLKKEKFPEEILNTNVNYSFNTGIFGGKNLELISSICKKILKYEKKYNELFLNLIYKIKNKQLSYNILLFAVIMDQSYVAYLLNEENYTPEFIDIGKINVLHFAGAAKTNPMFKEKLNYLCNNLLDKSPDLKQYFKGFY